MARTTTFRLTLSYSFIFAVSLGLLAFYFYWSTIGLVLRETDEILYSQTQALSKVYRKRGIDWLAKSLSVRAKVNQKMLYQFSTLDNRPLAGNLRMWPSVSPSEEVWVEFDYLLPGTEEYAPARGRVYPLPDGVQLLVARNVEEITQIKKVFNRSLQVGLGLTLLFALVGGIFMSRRVLRRVSEFTASTGQIVDGRLGERLTSRETGDEFDVLARHVNEMLDRLETLVGAVRHVSDNIAHDLRTPLTRLRNRIETASLGATDSVKGELEASVADADELLRTFSSLLKIARIESGSYKPSFERIDFAPLIFDAADLYQGLAQEKGLVLMTDCDPVIFIYGDRNLLFQAISNLVDNAIKYSPDGGAVSLIGRRDGDYAEVIVTDGGNGIPENEWENVLERFSRLDQSRSLPGSGLGLSVVNAVVKAHEAQLIFEDNSPGLKAVVKFSLVG